MSHLKRRGGTVQAPNPQTAPGLNINPAPKQNLNPALNQKILKILQETVTKVCMLYFFIGNPLDQTKMIISLDLIDWKHDAG